MRLASKGIAAASIGQVYRATLSGGRPVAVKVLRPDVMVKPGYRERFEAEAIAVAKLMPADSYGFKPVPDELTFGQVLIQVARANLGACAFASGNKRPDVAPALVEEESGKREPDTDAIVQFLAPGRTQPRVKVGGSHRRLQMRKNRAPDHLGFQKQLPLRARLPGRDKR